jgi:hypothetical protein
MFEFVKIPELEFDLVSETTTEGRKYVTPTGEKYPSVTTVLAPYGKKALFEWRNRVGDEEANRVAAKASRRGTALHTICEKYLLNELTPMKIQAMMPNVKELFVQLKPQLDDNIGKIFSLEQALYSDRLGVAGRVDCIAEWKGKIAVIDFKSASRFKSADGILNYFMQCAAYADMFEDRTGQPIDDLVVAIGVEGSKEAQIFEVKKDDYLPEFELYVDKYYRKNKVVVL